MQVGMKITPAVAATLTPHVSLYVSRFAVPHDSSECTTNRGLRRTSTHETSRNWPFGPAVDPHQLCLLEWTIATAEIRVEDKTDFGLVCGLWHDARFKERPHVRYSSNATSLTIKTYRNANIHISGGYVPTLRHFSEYFHHYECRVVGTAKRGSEEESYDCWERGCGMGAEANP
jgi:hypothetical protein